MGRYGTREAEVDRLLRERRPRRPATASSGSRCARRSRATRSRRWRRFYGFVREIDLRDAGSSIVAFEQWLELGEGDRPAATHLERIERYNRDDVVSNLQLRDWLEGRRDELAAMTGRVIPRPVVRDAPLPAEVTENEARVQALVDRLAGPAVVPTDPLDRSAEPAGDAGCWPSSWAGIAARTSRCGGTSTG